MTDLRYYGKFRGKVVHAIDPENRGRIAVLVPGVTGQNTSTWALPATPYAEPSHGLLAIPQPGASVWIEYEHGDPDYPIWTGCFWDDTEQLPRAASTITPGTRGLALEVDGTRLTLAADRSEAGGIVLETEGKARVQVHRDKLVLDNAGATVTLDSGGLTLEHTSGALTLKVGNNKITISQSGISLEVGSSKIELTSAQVNVNNGALTVT